MRRTGVCPAALEAGAVVGQHALDRDAVGAVEADELVQEGERGVGGLVGIDARRSRAGSGRRSPRTGTASRPCLACARAIAGDAVAGPEDAAELLAVDVHELARARSARSGRPARAGCARRAASGRAGAAPRARSRRRSPVPSRSRAVPSRSSTRARRIACSTDCRRPPRRALGPARAVAQRLASTSPVDPLRRGLPGAADDERRRGDRHSSADEITQALTLTDGQDRICMKIHKSPPLGRDSLTSRTLGGLVATSRRQQRVWEPNLDRRRAGSRRDVCPGHADSVDRRCRP